MKTMRQIFLRGGIFLCCGLLTTGWAGEEARFPALPEGVSGAQVVRLLQLSEEERQDLAAALAYLESLSEEERGQLRQEIRRFRNRPQRPGEDGPGADRSTLREEWRGFQQELTGAGIDWEGLRPEQRRHLFRIYRETAAAERPAMLEQWKERLERAGAGRGPERRESMGEGRERGERPSPGERGRGPERQP